MRRLAALALVLAVPPAAGAGEAAAWLDRLDRALVFETADGWFRTELGALADLEAYWVDERAPGLLYAGDDGFVNPRLSLFLDTQLGRRLYGLVQARFDRGFDPGSDSASARFDEYLLRWTPFDEPVVNVQAGKFATVVSDWVPRHHSWDNPLVNAPLPYENVTIVSDVTIVPTPEAFLARRSLPDRKHLWNPLVWGPSYATGLAAFGRIRRVDWAAEVKNASLSSRPGEWDGRGRQWEDPTASARLGWSPSAAWSFGAKYSDGSYLREAAEAALPPGRDAGDFRQRLVGVDARWAWRHLQLWAEIFLGRFEVPNVGDADTLAGYVEGRWKLTPRLSAALRWNQQLFGEVEDSTGRDRAWDRDVWRLDNALAWRIDRHLQAKVQYSHTRQSGGRQQGEQLFAGQLTLSF